MQKTGRKLKNTVIEPFKQFKIGVYVIIISFVFIICASYLYLSSFWQQYQHVMSIFSVVDPDLQWEVITNDVFIKNIVKVSALFILFMLIIMGVVFKLTHRYYGPLVSIEKFIDRISAGEYKSRVAIRKKDELVRLVNKLNSMAENLEERHGKDSVQSPAS